MVLCRDCAMYIKLSYFHPEHRIETPVFFLLPYKDHWTLQWMGWNLHKRGIYWS